MNKFLADIIEPLGAIKKKPYQFTVWWMVANLVGLIGLWLPLLLVTLSGEDPQETFRHVLNAGVLASFNVIILADGIATVLVSAGTGTNTVAAGIRGLFGTIALIIVVINVSMLGFMVKSGENIPPAFQVFLTAIAVLVAAYLYCFRFPDWEKSVDDAKKQEDSEVDNLNKRAEGQVSDRRGITL